MDFLSGNKNTQQQQQPATTQQGQPKEDYVDKAFDFAASKSGHNVNRSTGEKITDAGRNMYEKVTGSKVNEKISN